MADAGAERGDSCRSVHAPINPLIVHEWGTFLSVQGSDGVTLGGMVDSEEDLPAFVRERDLNGFSRASSLSKMETPVTYFYVEEPCRVSVKVKMPEGLLTHWYPSVQSFMPPTKLTTAPPMESGSSLDWGTFDLIPAKMGVDPNSLGHYPFARKERPWNFVRQTDSAYVRMAATKASEFNSIGNVEKFLFYRGLGTLDLPLHITSAGCKTTTLTFKNSSPETLQSAFVIQVGPSGIAYKALGSLKGKETAESIVPSDFVSMSAGVPAVKQAVATALIEAGLYRKEAEAMVNNWEHSYFRTPGIRVLYLLPRSLTDKTIPIEIKPTPWDLVRVMVGRVEVLTPNAEQSYERYLKDMAMGNEMTRKLIRTELAKLGRLQEPVLRRILAVSVDEGAKQQATVLLKEKPKL